MSGTRAAMPPSAHEGRTGPLIGVLVVEAFVMFLNETVFSVALPTLTWDLCLTTATAQWVISGYLVAMAIVLPVTGYLLDRFSVRRIFVGSLTVFIVGALIATLASAGPAPDSTGLRVAFTCTAGVGLVLAGLAPLTRRMSHDRNAFVS
ncbi:MFS transporter [Streptomyces sp. NPDC056987]|uniref:MFS transporter n=1 Tax=Streptomyces sp. NPDC056987 TaxID=3345988 RepID=UPI003626267C